MPAPSTTNISSSANSFDNMNHVQLTSATSPVATNMQPPSIKHHVCFAVGFPDDPTPWDCPRYHNEPISRAVAAFPDCHLEHFSTSVGNTSLIRETSSCLAARYR